MSWTKFLEMVIVEVEIILGYRVRMSSQDTVFIASENKFKKYLSRPCAISAIVL